MNKISFCTVCMNRLSHLRETLPVNIIENIKYPDIEFVVLDYNSQDGMESWIQSNLSQYIESGVLHYYKDYEPKYFDLSHSKNMALKLASGNIVCLIDADNYAGANYADWVDSVFLENGENTIITTLRKNHIPYRDQGGKLCFSKDRFTNVRGFDESLVGYGIDDVDLVNRLEKAGGKRVFLEEERYLKFISHSNIERLKNHHLMNNLENIYVQVTEFMEKCNRVLYILKDNRFIEVNYEYEESLKSNLILSYVGWQIKKNGHFKGTFVRTPGGLSLKYDNGTSLFIREVEKEVLVSFVNREKQSWKVISKDDDLFHGLIMGYGECLNRLKYIENDKSSNSINRNGWGNATVYLNFNRNNPIAI